jgi:hypothetical protein
MNNASVNDAEKIASLRMIVTSVVEGKRKMPY